VALALVFMSIGVTYFFVHQYGVSWNLLDRNWLDKNEWLGVIRGEGFLFEIWPLLGLVAVTSLISYLVITGAVRKYKRYLDSGLDYKNLLSSLRDIDDFGDKSKIERIKNHPELKRILLGFAETLEEKERLLGEREGALQTRVEETLRSKEKELADDFAEECERLAKAIEADSMDPGRIGISNPGLQKIGELVRGALQSMEQPGESELAESYGDLRKTSDVLQSKLHEITQELKLSCDGAQEIEEQIRQLAGSGPTDSQRRDLQSARKEIGAILASLRSLEELNAMLDLLSEEAKGIAISTALHAGSGAGTQDDLIKLAEEVRDVAARFKDATRRFIQVSAVMRSSTGVLDTLVESPADPADGTTDLEGALTGVLSRVTLWVERVVVLSDKISNFRESYGLAVSSLPDADPKETVDRTGSEESRTQETAQSEVFGFETLDRGGSLFAESRESRSGVEDGEVAGESIFEEMSSERLGSFDDAAGEEKMTRVEDQPRSDSFEPLSFEKFSPKSPRPAVGDRGAPLEHERFAVDERPLGHESMEPKTMEPEMRGETMRTRETGTQEADEDIVDLYALGAVDYDPTLHN
jgi:hypothetical protein